MDLIILTTTFVRGNLFNSIQASIFFAGVIFDEGHSVLSNSDNLTVKKLLEIKYHWSIILSGTPCSGDPKQVLSLLHCMLISHYCF